MQTAEELREALVEADERETREALIASRGNVSQAARALGISKPTIYRRMKRYGLERRVEIADRA